ncbi:hypothetical protein F3Y22_tig00110646pilonHSYRG00065 [Hibiscus syriacus]|uniref:RNase H type-1 domain-containing protein n=1 Tax=Hibiscus syriacus TaxID=106335 RepID=A0A6A3A0E0_HIBSY|nr:hypothetical protein F3Y22_tig00110646pilonHSYRG00065 [Hibiscus syriacus]
MLMVQYQPPAKASAGVLARDNLGIVVAGHAISLSGCGDAAVIEASALTIGIRLASSLQYPRVVVESDSLNLVKKLLHRRIDLSVALFHLEEAYQLLDSHTHVSVVYDRRTENQVAHALAHYASTSDYLLYFDYEYPD